MSVLQNEKYEENIIILYQKLMYRKAMRISPVDGIMQHKSSSAETAWRLKECWHRLFYRLNIFLPVFFFNCFYKLKNSFPQLK